jgi:cell wall assembly regulator SMI1
MADISELWARLEAWGNKNAPKMLEDLNPGASDEALGELQTALGLELPEPFLQCLRVHNGESDGWPFKVFADMGAYLPCEQIVENWQMRVQIAGQVDDDFSDEERAEQIRDGIIFIEGPVRPSVFNAGWVPIMDCNGDVFWALDFAPAEGGVPGQLIQVDLEGCDWKVVANSFDELFERYVEALEADEFEIDYHGVVTREPADEEQDKNDYAANKAFDSAPGIDDLKNLEPGSEVEIVGLRIGRADGDNCAMCIRGGDVNLKGSLRGTTFNEVLRVKIRVGKRRGMGLLGPRHEILSWGIAGEQSDAGAS